MTNPTSPMPPQQPGETPEPQPEPHLPDGGQPNPPGSLESPAGAATPPTAHRGLRGLPVWFAGAIAVAVVLVGGVAVINAVAGDTAKPTASTATPAAKPTPSAAPPTTAPSTTAAPTTAAPSPTKTTPPPKPTPVKYLTLSERQWKLIAKNPDSYIGKAYIVYGVVTQFDAATGTDTFRADVGHKKMPDEYDYRTNTLLTGSESGLKNLVEGDVFRGKVRVVGSFSYETQIGGETTVPLLRVDSIALL